MYVHLLSESRAKFPLNSIVDLHESDSRTAFALASRQA
jgi:hypothetical protein